MLRLALKIMAGLMLTMCALTAAAQVQSAPATSNPASQVQKPAPREEIDVETTRADLEKMQLILNQMRTNLGFVGNTTTPLNHQFELEIDMWQTLLDQMQHRIGRKPD